MGYWLWVIGYGLWVSGYWLWVIDMGYGLWVIGYWLLVIGYWLSTWVIVKIVFESGEHLCNVDEKRFYLLTSKSSKDSKVIIDD